MAAVAIAAVFSSGCARMYHLMHYNCFSEMVHEHHMSYYHSPKTGRIIPKEHDQRCAVELPCFGYEPTCWHRWPADCPNCPIEEEVVVSDSVCGPNCNADVGMIIEEGNAHAETITQPHAIQDSVTPIGPQTDSVPDALPAEAATQESDALGLPQTQLEPPIQDDAAYSPEPAADEWAVSEVEPNVSDLELKRVPLESAGLPDPAPAMAVTEREDRLEPASEAVRTFAQPSNSTQVAIPVFATDLTESPAPEVAPDQDETDAAQPAATAEATPAPVVPAVRDTRDAVPMVTNVPTFRIKAQRQVLTTVATPPLQLEGAPAVTVRILPEAKRADRTAVNSAQPTQLNFR